MIRNVGMIGTGNMGSAILRGIVEASYVKPTQLTVFDVSRRKLKEIEEDIPGIQVARDCLEVAEAADLIILAVKPLYVREVIDEIRPGLQGKAVLSIAAGWTVSMLEEALRGTGATYLRVMPNTPALVGEGMTALCDDTTFSQEDFDYAKGIFDAVGKTRVLPERLFDGPITSWELDGETVETVSDFIFLGSKITADGDCSYDIKRHLLLGRKAKAMTI